jgi:enediyne biosynthesis protein E4
LTRVVHRYLPFGLLFVSAIVLLSCKEREETKEDGQKLFKLIPPQETGVFFENTLSPNQNNNILEYDYFYNGSGVGAADFNNDGLVDLFFNACQEEVKLYLNMGDFKFQDVTASSGIIAEGWGSGVSLVDINNDGWQDIYLSHAGLHHSPNQLFINQGQQVGGAVKFSEQAKTWGLDFKGFNTHAAFFDYDRDDDVDLYLLNHGQDKLNQNYPKVKQVNGLSPSNDKLFRNDGKKFVEVTVEAGITTEGYGLGIAIADFNNDNWPDIYVANDFAYDDLMYMNNQDGTFTESAMKSLDHTSQFSMGCDVADFNNDMLPDIIVADMMPGDNERQKLMSPGTTNDVFNLSLQRDYLPQYSRNVLQLNRGMDEKGRAKFSEIGQLAGVSKTDWSWTALFADLDNDGWKDIFISNGIPHDITNSDFVSYRANELSKQGFDYNQVKKKLLEKIELLDAVDKPNFVFKNNTDLTFTDKSEPWDLDNKGFSNGAALADFDNDGDMDMAVSNLNAPAFILKNQSERLLNHHYLNLKFTGHLSAGIKVKITCDSKAQFIEHNRYRGFLSTQEDLVHFGMGKDSIVDKIEIIWPDGNHQELSNVQGNQTLVVTYKPESKLHRPAVIPPNASVAKPLFKEALPALIDFIHQENTFEDFNIDPLLPHRLSRNGPCMAVGDLDGNGFEDLWIGGPAMIAGRIFMQQGGGKFHSVEMPDPGYEDAGGLFFDADNDKDLDLYVVSGGSEYNPFTATYQDRLYINKGKGRLALREQAIPTEGASGSCVVANDFDKDGDLDLFVGGRVTPSRYPVSPESFLLENDGKGTFKNVTREKCAALKNLGMITASLWSDYDNDGWSDLIVTGEWMGIEIFRNDHGIFQRMEKPIPKTKAGWWFSLASGDFDSDGDIDFIGGNLGLNNNYHVTDSFPLTMYANDFDGNGKIEPIISYYNSGIEYPLADRAKVASVLPVIKKKFDTYSKYAKAEFSQLFAPDLIKQSLILKATTFSSTYIENKGNNEFVLRDLPIEAQFSAVQSMHVKDFNRDGTLDVLLAGNFYSPDFRTGRYDASCGLLLIGDGHGNFSALTPSYSGVMLKGDVRDTKMMHIGNKAYLISVGNSGRLQTFLYQP